MRILFLALDIDLKKSRGDIVYALNLARSLVRIGHEIHIITGGGPATIRVPGASLSVGPDGGNLVVLRYVLGVIRSFRPDIIYERRFSPKIAEAASALLSVPFAVEYNGLVDEEAAMLGRTITGGAASRLKERIRHRMLRQAAGVIAVTPGLRDAVINRFGVPASKVYVVPNGVDASVFHPRDWDESRYSLGLPPNPVLCFVGNLVRWQGLRTLIDGLLWAPPELTLVIVGTGPKRELLIKRANEAGVSGRLRFAGEVPNQVVPQYIAAADACVAPFRSARNLALGASALKLCEYLACARPVIASSIPGARELIEEFQCGKVVPPDDPKSLGTSIREVLADRAYSERALRASEAIRDRHSWRRTVEQVDEILRTAVGLTVERRSPIAWVVKGYHGHK